MVVCSDFSNEHPHEISLCSRSKKRSKKNHSLILATLPQMRQPRWTKEMPKTNVMPLLWIEHSTSRNRMSDTGDLKWTSVWRSPR